MAGLSDGGFGELGALVVEARGVARWDATSGGDDELLERFAAVEAARRALDAASAELVAELDGRGTCDERFGFRTHTWIAAEFHVERRDAARRVRVGRRLRLLGVVADALVDGRITFEHARVLVDAANSRVRDVVIGAQAELVDLATRMRFEVWARHVRALVDLADADGGHDPSPERRSVTWGWGLDGVLHLSGVLLGSDAAAFEHLLELHTNRLARRAARDAQSTPDLPRPTRAQLRADALIDLIRRGAGAEPSRGPVVEATITIPVDHPALGSRAGASIPAGTGLLRGAAADVMLCDPVVRALVVDSLGVPLDLGRAVRFATPDQRRAVTARDGGCVFPGCDAVPNWCDIHHVVRVADGGATDLVNLAMMCRHHHGVVHRTGWSMVHTGGQRFRIVTPRGRPLQTQRHGVIDSCGPP